MINIAHIANNATHQIKLKQLLENPLFKALLPPPESGSELVLGDEMQDSLQGRLHRLLGQPVARQQHLYSG